MGELFEPFEIFDRGGQSSDLVVVEHERLKAEERIEEVLLDLLYFVLFDAERIEPGECL